MIDEALEEQASLYALGLLEGEELAAFQAQLANDPALVRLVRELTEAATQLAFTARSPAPPPGLKDRLLNRIETATRWRNEPAKASPFTAFSWVPWAAAAGLAITCAWLGQLYFVNRSETSLARDQKTLAEFQLASVRNELQAERLLAQHEVNRGSDRAATLEKDLADLRQQLADTNAQLTGAQKLAAARDSLLAIDADRIAAIESKSRHDADLANFKIATLASLLGNSPQALAVAVWNPSRQEGVLHVEKLPALAADKDYQLWLVDPQYPAPVNGGVFTVDPDTGEARVEFKASKPIRSVAKFAVSLEKKGGVSKSEGPMVLLSQ